MVLSSPYAPAVPLDVQSIIGRREVWRSLKTRDRAEALRRVREASVEFDREMAAHRARLATKPLDVLSEVQLKALADLALHEQLADDEDFRATEVSPQSAEQDRQDSLERLAEARHRLATSDFEGLERYGERVLAEAGLRMAPSSNGFRKLMYRLLAAFVEATEKELQRWDGVPVATPQRPAVAPAQAAYTLDQLMRDYMADPGKARSEKTRIGYEIIFGVLRELLGSDKPVSEITRDDCRRVQSLLLRLPTNTRKHYPSLSLEEASQCAQREGRAVLSPGTVNSYLNNLSSLFRWAEQEGKIIKNPAAGLKVVDTVKDADRRRPFPIEGLQAIFSAPLYAAHRRGGRNQRGIGPNTFSQGRFWVPLLALFHGIRQTEACQLLVDDVRQIGPVWCLVLTEDAGSGERLDEEDRKRIKTDAGERFVPVHQEVIRIGFLDYVAEMRRGKQRRLFPDIKRGEDGYFSPFSKWFSRFLEAIGAKQRRLSFHSLRHNYRDALRRAQLSGDIVRALGGWSSGRTEDDYGGDLIALVPTLAEAMDRVSYPGLHLNHLREVDAPIAVP